MFADKSLFKTYEEVTDGQEVQMGNQTCAKVAGRGNVELNFTSGKTLTLLNVLHVPNIRKNLVSVNLVCKRGFKVVFESDKLILSKNGMFVGKGYGCNGMFKLSINERKVSAYIVDYFYLWHDRLEHLNFKSIKNISKLGIIACSNESTEKCEICVKSKMAKKHFPNVERNSQLLEPIRSDICELNGVLTRGGKRYFITFIDDFSRYTYVYLMRTKDEAFDMFKLYKTEVENQLERKIHYIKNTPTHTGNVSLEIKPNGV